MNVTYLELFLTFLVDIVPVLVLFGDLKLLMFLISKSDLLQHQLNEKTTFSTLSFSAFSFS